MKKEKESAHNPLCIGETNPWAFLWAEFMAVTYLHETHGRKEERQGLYTQDHKHTLWKKWTKKENQVQHRSFNTGHEWKVFSWVPFRLRTSFIFLSGFSPSRGSGRSQKFYIHSESDCGYPSVPWLWEQSQSQPCVFREKVKGQADSEEPESHRHSP